MKKILYITTLDITINAFLVSHIEMLMCMGHIVDCACKIDNGIDGALLMKGVRIYDIPFTRNPMDKKNIKAFLELIKIQKENNYDVVHVHTPIAALFGRLLKIRYKNIKTIYTAHGYHFHRGGSRTAWLIYYPIEKLMAKLTDVTININREDYEITRTRLKPKNFYLVNGVGLELDKYKPLEEDKKIRKRQELKLKDDEFIIIMIAELNENKNQMQLIKAMELLKEKYPKIKALCVGEGDKLHELQDEVRCRGLENNISFLGYRNDVNELINVANIGILLSYREGLPRSIMELMANGKKVIGTNIRGNRDLICNKNVGTLVEVGDYVATADSIENYYISNIGDKIPEEIKNYEVEEVLKDLKMVYQNL